MRNNAANFGEVLVMLSFRVHTTMPTTIYVQCTCNAVCAFHMAKPKALRICGSSLATLWLHFVSRAAMTASLSAFSSSLAHCSALPLEATAAMTTSLSAFSSSLAPYSA